MERRELVTVAVIFASPAPLEITDWAPSFLPSTSTSAKSEAHHREPWPEKGTQTTNFSSFLPIFSTRSHSSPYFPTHSSNFCSNFRFLWFIRNCLCLNCGLFVDLFSRLIRCLGIVVVERRLGSARLVDCVFIFRCLEE